MRALILPALIVAGSAHAADIDYRRYNFLHTGYSDKQLSPDVWRVKGSAHEMGGGIAVALYRAAELATAARVGEVRVTKQKVNELTISRRGGGLVSFTETATVTVRFVREAADRTACDEQEAHRCLTLPVAGLLARYGDRVGRPTARLGEVPAAPITLVTYDRRQGAPAPWQVEAARRWPEPVRITPGTMLLPGGLATSTVRAAAPVAAPRIPLPASLPAAPVAPRLSAAEREAAMLRAASAADGDAGGSRALR